MLREVTQSSRIAWSDGGQVSHTLLPDYWVMTRNSTMVLGEIGELGKISLTFQEGREDKFMAPEPRP